MRKIVLIALLVCGAKITVNAQQFKYGAKVSLNIAGMISGTDLNDESAKIGMTAGGIAEYRFASNWFAVQTEVLYSIQGTSKNDEPYINEAIDLYHIDVNYINIPVMARFYIFKGVNLYAGPQLSLLVSSAIEGDNSEAFEFEKTTFGGVFGGGYEFDSGFLVDARLNIGFTEAIANTGYTNLVFQIGVGYKFK